MVRKHAHPSSGSNNNNNPVKKCTSTSNCTSKPPASTGLSSRQQQQQTNAPPPAKRKRSEERGSTGADDANDRVACAVSAAKKPRDEEDPTTKKLQETEEALRSLSGAGLLLQSGRDDPADTPFVNLFEKEAQAEKPPSAVASAWKDVVSVSSCSSNGSAPSPALNIVTSPRVDLSCVKQEPPSTPQAAAVSSPAIFSTH